MSRWLNQRSESRCKQVTGVAMNVFCFCLSEMVAINPGEVYGWTPLIGKGLRKDKCFRQHERSAQERYN